MITRIKKKFFPKLHRKELEKICKKAFQYAYYMYNKGHANCGMCYLVETYLYSSPEVNHILPECGFNLDNFSDFVIKNYPQYEDYLSYREEDYWLDYEGISPSDWINIRKEFLKTLI